jgi:hypothetical protein
MVVAYRLRSIPFVPIRSPLEEPNAASHAAQTGDSVQFSSPQTEHRPALISGFTKSDLNPILASQQLIYFERISIAAVEATL